MNAIVRQFRNFFVSLELTVGLLILSLVLVFVATLDQVNLGIWAVQEKYFRSFFVFWYPGNSDVPIPVFPGGYLIGGFLLVNLIAAHIYRFQMAWRKAGIQLAHAGLILLLTGELLTGLFQRESMMRLDEGETKQYSEAPRDFELVLIDHTDPKFDEVVAIPEARVAEGGTLQHPKLPFLVRIKNFYPNAAVQMRDPNTPSALASIATTGHGTRLSVFPLRVTYKPDERNTPAAHVELAGPDGPLGTWLVSPLLLQPQTFTYQDHTWEISLRSTRYYKPFSVQLLKFTHDKYPGTEIPRNFSSRVRVRTDDGREDREVLIFMNNPLRFHGLTFYQAGFDNNDRTTVLQVVRNPSWLLPYIACVMMGLGLVIQFGYHLIGFARRRGAKAA